MRRGMCEGGMYEGGMCEGGMCEGGGCVNVGRTLLMLGMKVESGDNMTV